MSTKIRASLLALLQLLIVLLIAAKYGYERRVCPRVWVKTSSVDPELPVRGRYLWLPVEVNACGLKPEGDTSWVVPNAGGRSRYWSASLAARDGQMIAYQEAGTPIYRTVRVIQQPTQSCDHSWLSQGIPFFVPDTAQSPNPLKRGQELWVEVTVPPAGPPRALSLAFKEGGKLQRLNFR